MIPKEIKIGTQTWTVVEHTSKEDGMLYELVDGKGIHVLQTRVEEIREGMRVIFKPDRDYWLRSLKP